MNFQIQTCNDKVFEKIKVFISEFELDERDLKKEEFLHISEHGESVGFARLRKYHDCLEICSVGIIPQKRNHGLGKRLINSLLKNVTLPVYLVTIIPDYFIKLGFAVCNNFPKAMKNKLKHCTCNLPVKEQYVVMKFTSEF